MIPLRDANPSSTRPVVTVAIIVLNALAFFYELALSQPQLERLMFTMGMIPARVLLFPARPDISLADAFLPMFSSMFLHGGWMHLIGNMWFLWIFGDNVEDHLGHVRYGLFYVVCGLGAGLAHTVFNLNSTIPTIGASGAVAGVLGAYFLLYPMHRVVTLIPIFFYFTFIELPAAVVLLFWFALQFLRGAVSIGSQSGGVAWWAHVGGFVIGVVLVKVLGRRRRVSLLPD